jgi:hypothetical protein
MKGEQILRGPGKHPHMKLDWTFHLEADGCTLPVARKRLCPLS